MMARRMLATLGLILMAGPASAQISMGPADGANGRYGEPVDVELEDLARGTMGYSQRAVRTHGTLGFADRPYYELTEMSARIVVIPVPNIAGSDVERLLGREVDVVGLVRELQYDQGTCLQGIPQSLCDNPDLPPTPNLKDHPGWPQVSITIWSVSEAPKTTDRKKVDAALVTLEDLVQNPGKRDGQTVKVVGKFRGKNLYGDLPVRSQRLGSDWVIKDDLYAVWVSKKRPKGDGWELDTGLKRDTGKWIEVIGRPETVGGVTYIRATQVALTTPPSATADAKPPPPPPQKPRVPPVVVFAMPLDGDGEVAPDGRFVVQFSRDMDEASFKGRVLLRYAGPQQAGDRALDGVKLTYDGGRRALTVDPGDVLRPGRAVELLLLPGIVDLEGLPLASREGARVAEAAIDSLRYRVSR